MIFSAKFLDRDVISLTVIQKLKFWQKIQGNYSQEKKVAIRG